MNRESHFNSFSKIRLLQIRLALKGRSLSKFYQHKLPYSNRQCCDVHDFTCMKSAVWINVPYNTNRSLHLFRYLRLVKFGSFITKPLWLYFHWLVPFFVSIFAVRTQEHDAQSWPARARTALGADWHGDPSGHFECAVRVRARRARARRVQGDLRARARSQQGGEEAEEARDS